MSFNTIWFNLRNDIKLIWTTLSNIFETDDVRFFFFLIMSIFVSFFYITYLFFVVCLWLVYFYGYYFFCTIFKIEKCQQLDFLIYNTIIDTFDLNLGNIFVFLKNFLYYIPKFTAFRFYYNSIKVYHEKENSNMYLFLTIMLVTLLIAFPFRILVKWVTGFSFFSIKTGVICTNQLFEIPPVTNWNLNNFYFEVVEVYLQLLSSYYCTGLFLDVFHKKIYFNRNGLNIGFNPPHPDLSKLDLKYAYYFKNLDYVAKALGYLKKSIVPKKIMVNTVDSNNNNFNGFSILNKNGEKIVLVQSLQDEPLKFKNGTKWPILNTSVEGLQKQKHVYNYIPASDTNNITMAEIIKYKERDAFLLETDKFLASKALLSSSYKFYYSFLQNGIQKDQLFNNLWERISDLHDRKKLFPDLFYFFEFFHGFTSQNFGSVSKIGARAEEDILDILKEEIEIRETRIDHKLYLFDNMLDNTQFVNGKIYVPESITELNYGLRKSIDFLNNFS